MRSEDEEAERKRGLSFVEEQNIMESYEHPFPATYGDFQEMVIQFGFMTLFAVAYPIGALFALINNIIEIRVDGQKLTTDCRRPRYREAEDIGSWMTVLQCITVVAVITNCLLVSFTSTVRSDISSPIGSSRWLALQNCTALQYWCCVCAPHSTFRPLLHGPRQCICRQCSSQTAIWCPLLQALVNDVDMFASVATRYGKASLWLTVLVMEHLLLLIKFLLSVFVPDEVGSDPPAQLTRQCAPWPGPDACRSYRW